MEISNTNKTTILYESPHRIKKFLNELKDYCGGEREIEVSRELTKRFEEHIGSNINEVINSFKNREPSGEFTIVIKGINKKIENSIDKFEIKKDLQELREAGLSLSAASKYLAKKLNISKSTIYNLY